MTPKWIVYFLPPSLYRQTGYSFLECFSQQLDWRPVDWIHHHHMSRDTFSLLQDPRWHPHPPHPSRCNLFALVFYSSDGTLNLGHHLDRENRPHIQGRWLAGMMWVYWGGGCNWFPDSALRGNQVKLSLFIQALTLQTAFFKSVP